MFNVATVKTTKQFWQIRQCDVVRFDERNEHDMTKALSKEGQS